MTTSAAIAMALAGLTAGSGSVPPPNQPVRLDIVDAGDHVTITVIGASDVPVNAGFHLNVTSAGRGGTNHNVQSGRAQLVPGKPVTMVTLSVSTEALSEWHATLNVERDGKPAYTVERGSAAR